MATVTSWTESLPAGDTVIYPFVGTEWLWLLIAVVFWIYWHVTTSAVRLRSMKRWLPKARVLATIKIL